MDGIETIEPESGGYPPKDLSENAHNGSSGSEALGDTTTKSLAADTVASDDKVSAEAADPEDTSAEGQVQASPITTQQQAASGDDKAAEAAETTATAEAVAPAQEPLGHPPVAAANEPEMSAEPAAAAAGQKQPQTELDLVVAQPAENGKQEPTVAAAADPSGSPNVPISTHSDTSRAQASAKPAKKSSSSSSTAALAPEPKQAASEQVEHGTQHAAPSEAQQHKETAVERLTTPTAMRMLNTLQQTQGGKQEWHIATGVPFKSKQLSPDEMSAMVERLCTPKHEADNLPPKLHAVKLVFEGNKEVLVPVKETTKQDNITYMASLYGRCQETRAKTMQTLQDRWLQPLIKPKQAAK